LSGLLEEVRALAPRIRAAAPRIETDRRLPAELFEELAATGVFKAYLPPQCARMSELAPVIEEIARADGSAGWLAYVGSEALRQTNLLAPPVAATITASPRAFIAGMFTAGPNRAVAVPGGYRVSGRWHTCSGSLHADWMIGGATVYDGDAPRRHADGSPVVRLNFIPMSSVTVLDTWYVGGLKGTNSNDLMVEDAFVPEGYGAYDVPPPDLGLHMMVPLGIARAAMEEFLALASTKGPSKAGGALYRDLPAVQREVAAAEASLRAARVYALESLAEVDARQSTSPAQRDDFFLVAHHVGRTCVEVVDTLHRAAGTAGIFSSSQLLRCFNDVHVAVAHVSLQAINLEAAGRRLMGG
jgi:indole-3-acetate monooxygenase